MHIRLSKILLVSAIAFYLSLIVFNNVLDYRTNFTYVSHIMTMDTVFRNNSQLWRAVPHNFLHHTFFIVIIFVEAVAAILCWMGAYKMLQTCDNPKLFNHNKAYAVYGLTLAILLWLVGFTAIGGEWFMMWQSRSFNGIQAASRLTMLSLLALLYISQKDEAEY